MASGQTMAGVPAIPPGLTPDGLKDIYQKWSQLKQAGADESNPEFVRLQGILAAVKQQKAFNQQRRTMQPQQGQQQRPAVNGTPARNGVNGVHPPSNTTPAPVQSPTTSKMNGTAQQMRPRGAFTSEQLSTLRHQIMAFKLLQKNEPIPLNIQQQLFPSMQKAQTPTVDSKLSDAASTLEEKPIIKEEKPGYKTFLSPYERLQKAIPYGQHANRGNRLMIPSIMPLGLDIDQLREDRERVVYNTIMARRAELEDLPANLAFVDASKGTEVDESAKLKAILEYKMLGLLSKQRQMRTQFSRDLITYDHLAMTANRTMYRRIKKLSLREARITEKLEKQQRDARETRERKKHSDYLNTILTHGQEIKNAAAQQHQRVQKLGRLMLVHHQAIEKEEQKRIERTAKQRLQALKANDEEAYLKLLDQAKDTRITHLIKQTDGFLSQLASSVKKQQRDAAERYGETEYTIEEIDEDHDDDDAKVDYYQVAHRVQESVTKQPDLLVGGQLKEYQIRGLQWMVSLYNNNLNGILADEMGLGKTIQTISLVTFLIETKKQMGPYLIIVPLSTLTNWTLEFERWAPSLKKIVYKGPPNTRKQQQQAIRWGQFQVLLTTYEYIIKDRPVLSKVRWTYMIVDEGHRMKNANSKLALTLTQYYSCRFRLLLTGTPLQNNLPELWALLNFVLPTIFKSVKSFDEWFNTPFANTGSQDKMELTEEEQLLIIRRLHKVLRPFLLRRLKKDVEKELPDKTEKVIKCAFSALQSRLYKQMLTHNMLFINDDNKGKTTVKGLSNMLMQLRKLCNHPFVFEEVESQVNPNKITDDLVWRTAGKFELLDRILPKLKATGHRVLLFFQMTQIMNIMEDFMLYRGYKYLRLDGSTKADERSDLLRVFNEPNSEYFCFLLSTRAGGLGLNLQTADTVIIYDSDWNPFQDLQAQDRAHRIGQKNEVRILRLISSNSVEEKILERAQYKLDMDGKVIQAGKFDNKSTENEREAMLRVMLETAEPGDEAEIEELDDDYLNSVMSRSAEEEELFHKMDVERQATSEYGPGKKLGRLVGDSELPQIYLDESGPVVEKIEEYAGRGARERTQIKYDDGLTEEQWLDAVDNDDDSLEAAIERNNARKARLKARKDTRDNPESDVEMEEVPLPKKRGRKPKVEKRKAEEALEEPTPKRKRGRQPKSSRPADLLSDSDRKALQKILNTTYTALMDLREEDDDDDEEDDEDDKRAIIDPFVELPSKRDYPDYYVLIQNPIAMSLIKKKINRDEYYSARAFFDDVRTLCNNARTYNEDGSLLFIDANTIQSTAVAKLKELTADYPQWQDFEEEGPGEPPVPAEPATNGAPPEKLKLKLTFSSAAAAEGADSEPASVNGDSRAGDSD